MLSPDSLLADGHFLGYMKEIVVRIFPVYQAYLPVRESRSPAYGDRIAEGVIDTFIAVVQCLTVWAGGFSLEFIDSLCGLRTCKALIFRKIFSEDALDYISVLGVFEVAEILVAVVLPQESDNPVLDGSFRIG